MPEDESALQWYEALHHGPRYKLEITPEQREDILEQLAGESSSDRLAVIKIHLETYYNVARFKRKHPPPKPKDDKRKLEQITKLVVELIQVFDTLSLDAWDKLQLAFVATENRITFPSEDYPDTKSSFVQFCDIDPILQRVGIAAKLAIPKGKPPKTEEAILVAMLAYTWAGVHGKLPSRSYRWDARTESGPFRRFVDVCLRAIPKEYRPEKVPDGIIRKVLKQIRSEHSPELDRIWWTQLDLAQWRVKKKLAQERASRDLQAPEE